MIDYKDKIDTELLSDIPEENKITAGNMNSIKSVVNATIELLFGANGTTFDSKATYTKGDIVSYNYKLYENLTGTAGTNPSTDSINWSETSILVKEWKIWHIYISMERGGRELTKSSTGGLLWR